VGLPCQPPRPGSWVGYANQHDVNEFLPLNKISLALDYPTLIIS
jgi:hypothetical protein